MRRQTRAAFVSSISASVSRAAARSSTTPNISAAGCRTYVCSPSLVFRNRRLVVVRPDLVSEWQTELNNDVDINKVECSWEYLAWWRCGQCGHNWQATVEQRAVKESHHCPECELAAADIISPGAKLSDPSQQHAAGAAAVPVSEHRNDSHVASKPKSLLETHPHIAAHWDYELNERLRPEDVNALSATVVWWRPSSLFAENSEQPDAPFQRAVFQFVYDSRSPRDQKADSERAELKLLSDLGEIAQQPPIATVLSSEGLKWTPEAWSAVAVDIAAQKRAGRVSKEMQGLPPGPTPRSIEEALRLKALSYYLSNIAAARANQAYPTASFSTRSDISRHIDSVTPLPSAIFPDEKAAWKKYFMVPSRSSMADSHLSSESVAYPDVDDDSVQFQSFDSKAPPLPPSAPQAPSNSPTTSSAASPYPRANFLKPPALEDSAESAQPKPRVVRRSQREGIVESRANQQKISERGRDRDGTPETFGKFDQLLDEYDAATRYDQSYVATEEALLNAVGVKVDASRPVTSKFRRRGFSMVNAPTDDDDVSTAPPPSAASTVVKPTPSSPLSQGPRKVARTRRLTADE